MKIPHLKLEAVRKNPKNYDQILNEKQSFGKSKYNCWKNAINFYHKPDNDLNGAETYLINMFNKNFVHSRKNEKDLEKFINELHKYVYDFNELDNEVFRTKTRIDFDLSYHNILSGEINRIDTTNKDENEIYLVTKEDFEWEKELRFPLFQYFLAQKYKWDYNKVSVGTYCYSTAQHTVKKYNEDEIKQALEETRRISKNLK